ncbi:pyridoxal phosphate-dependent decarboxylase family protein [Mycolicibacterium celeriflavum]|uniref:pyridoxal phosphate-dependent decarboxylase family protein n=1 Tax=Mycolicibacterium celeriflavum TaxID=1249101 RepID=UPI003CF5C026
MQALPVESTPPRTVLAMLNEIGSPATVATAGGRYFGFVTGGSHPAALAANLLAGVWDQNGAYRVMSPVAAKLEEVGAAWMGDLLDLPADAGAGFTTGATMANLTALAAARHAVLRTAGWDVEQDGLFGAPAIRVVVGDEVHASVLKALSLLGLGRARIERVVVDGQGRLRADALPALTPTTIVCIQAGNVNTGAFDPATFGDDDATRRVIERVQADGTCWFGGTEWQGRAAMRVSVSSWATTEVDVARSLDAVLRIAGG